MHEYGTFGQPVGERPKIVSSQGVRIGEHDVGRRIGRKPAKRLEARTELVIEWTPPLSDDRRGQSIDS